MPSSKIEPIKDQEIHLFIERAIYGGLVFYKDRHVKCDPKNTENPTYELYLDTNALYEQYMSTFLMPTEDLKFLDRLKYPSKMNELLEVSGC